MQSPIPVIPKRLWFRWPLVAVPLALAAAVIVVPVLKRAGRGEMAVAPDSLGQITARGAGTPAIATAAVAAEVLLVRSGRLVALAGQPTHVPDGFAVRVSNLSSQAVHLIAFARDAAGQVHWLYPSYQRSGSNPSSVAIVAGTKDALLDEVVQPEGPTAGRLRLVTLLSPSALSVNDVESRLSGQPPEIDLAALFPGAIARQWSVTWDDAKPEKTPRKGKP